MITWLVGEKVLPVTVPADGVKTGVKTIKEAKLVVRDHVPPPNALVAQGIERRFPNWSQGTWWPG